MRPLRAPKCYPANKQPVICVCLCELMNAFAQLCSLLSRSVARLAEVDITKRDSEFIYHVPDHSLAAPPVPDVALPVYKALDWSRTYVGGSHALQQFTRDTAWTAQDVDFMIQCQSHDDFVAEAGRISRALDAPVKKTNLYTAEMRRSPVSGREERFHEAIAATCTLQVPGVPVPVQLVGIELVASNAQGMPVDLLAQLNRITDLPACVTYTVRASGERDYQVRASGINTLVTRRVKAWDICTSRRDKYAARGYVFDA